MRTSKKELLEIASYLLRYGKEKPLVTLPSSHWSHNHDD